MSRRIKRRAWWFSWAEWSRNDVAQADYLDELRKRGWEDGGRIEMVEFTDGSAEVRVPCRDPRDGSRMTRLVHLAAKEMVR